MTRDINAYLRELLFGHDCVIVPGFGAFICNYFPARIDREDGLFYPPAKRITFNRHLVTNDGLLIGHISTRTGVGYGEARDLISEYADYLRKRTTEGEKVILEHIGSFAKNREGTIIFEPDSEANYLLTSFGLESFHRKPVKDMDIRRRVLDYHQEPSVRQPSVRHMLTRAAVIVPLLVAMALVPFHGKIFKGKVEEAGLNPLATAEFDYNREKIISERPLVKVDSGAGKVNDTTAEVESGAREVIAAPMETATGGKKSEPAFVPAQPLYKYMLITGSFKTEANALTMVETLRSRGYNPEVAAGPDSFLRVSAVTFETLEEAKTALASLNPGFPETWICKSR